MARARTAKHPEPVVEPEADTVGNPSPAVSKADMVRSALAAGMETPTDGLGFIKSKYGVDFPRPMWSSYRAQLRAQERKKALKGASRGRGPKAAAEGPATSRRSASMRDGDLLDALEAMKPLVESLGAEKIKRLVDLLG